MRCEAREPVHTTGRKHVIAADTTDLHARRRPTVRARKQLRTGRSSRMSLKCLTKLGNDAPRKGDSGRNAVTGPDDRSSESADHGGN